MKTILKKIAKIVVVLILSIIITYAVLTLKDLKTWCDKNNIFLFGEDYNEQFLLKLDSGKVQEIGDEISITTKILEESLNDPFYEENEDYFSIAEYYDPLGFSVWRYMQGGIGEISGKYIDDSILIGVVITIAYAIITASKINNILKVVIGYVGVIIVIPPISMYMYTQRFWEFSATYLKADNIKFYIGYTAIFVIMYVINYIVSVKMTSKLNQIIKDKQNIEKK